MKRRVFWFHFNKNEYRKTGKIKWTLHWNNACHIVDRIVCAAPVQTKIRNRQPFAVVYGTTPAVLIDKGVAVIAG